LVVTFGYVTALRYSTLVPRLLPHVTFCYGWLRFYTRLILHVATLRFVTRSPLHAHTVTHTHLRSRFTLHTHYTLIYGCYVTVTVHALPRLRLPHHTHCTVRGYTYAVGYTRTAVVYVGYYTHRTFAPVDLPFGWVVVAVCCYRLRLRVYVVGYAFGWLIARLVVYTVTLRLVGYTPHVWLVYYLGSVPFTHHVYRTRFAYGYTRLRFTHAVYVYLVYGWFTVLHAFCTRCHVTRLVYGCPRTVTRLRLVTVTFTARGSLRITGWLHFTVYALRYVTVTHVLHHGCYGLHTRCYRFCGSRYVCGCLPAGCYGWLRTFTVGFTVTRYRFVTYTFTVVAYVTGYVWLRFYAPDFTFTTVTVTVLLLPRYVYGLRLVTLLLRLRFALHVTFARYTTGYVYTHTVVTHTVGLRYTHRCVYPLRYYRTHGYTFGWFTRSPTRFLRFVTCVTTLHVTRLFTLVTFTFFAVYVYVAFVTLLHVLRFCRLRTVLPFALFVRSRYLYDVYVARLHVTHLRLRTFYTVYRCWLLYTRYVRLPVPAHTLRHLLRFTRSRCTHTRLHVGCGYRYVYVYGPVPTVRLVYVALHYGFVTHTVTTFLPPFPVYGYRCVVLLRTTVGLVYVLRLHCRLRCWVHALRYTRLRLRLRLVTLPVWFAHITVTRLHFTAYVAYTHTFTVGLRYYIRLVYVGLRFHRTFLRLHTVVRLRYTTPLLRVYLRYVCVTTVLLPDYVHGLPHTFCTRFTHGYTRYAHRTVGFYLRFYVTVAATPVLGLRSPHVRLHTRTVCRYGYAVTCGYGCGYQLLYIRLPHTFPFGLHAVTLVVTRLRLVTHVYVYLRLVTFYTVVTTRLRLRFAFGYGWLHTPRFYVHRLRLRLRSFYVGCCVWLRVRTHAHTVYVTHFVAVTFTVYYRLVTFTTLVWFTFTFGCCYCVYTVYGYVLFVVTFTHTTFYTRLLRLPVYGWFTFPVGYAHTLPLRSFPYTVCVIPRLPPFGILRFAPVTLVHARYAHVLHGCTVTLHALHTVVCITRLPFAVTFTVRLVHRILLRWLRVRYPRFTAHRARYLPFTHTRLHTVYTLVGLFYVYVTLLHAGWLHTLVTHTHTVTLRLVTVLRFTHTARTLRWLRCSWFVRLFTRYTTRVHGYGIAVGSAFTVGYRGWLYTRVYTGLLHVYTRSRLRFRCYGWLPTVCPVTVGWLILVLTVCTVTPFAHTGLHTRYGYRTLRYVRLPHTVACTHALRCGLRLRLVAVGYTVCYGFTGCVAVTHLRLVWLRWFTFPVHGYVTTLVTRFTVHALRVRLRTHAFATRCRFTTLHHAVLRLFTFGSHLRLRLRLRYVRLRWFTHAHCVVAARLHVRYTHGLFLLHVLRVYIRGLLPHHGCTVTAFYVHRSGYGLFTHRSGCDFATRATFTVYVYGYRFYVYATFTYTHGLRLRVCVYSYVWLLRFYTVTLRLRTHHRLYYVYTPRLRSHTHAPRVYRYVGFYRLRLRIHTAVYGYTLRLVCVTPPLVYCRYRLRLRSVVTCYVYARLRLVTVWLRHVLPVTFTHGFYHGWLPRLPRFVTHGFIAPFCCFVVIVIVIYCWLFPLVVIAYRLRYRLRCGSHLHVAYAVYVRCYGWLRWLPVYAVTDSVTHFTLRYVGLLRCHVVALHAHTRFLRWILRALRYVVGLHGYARTFTFGWLVTLRSPRIYVGSHVFIYHGYGSRAGCRWLRLVTFVRYHTRTFYTFVHRYYYTVTTCGYAVHGLRLVIPHLRLPVLYRYTPCVRTFGFCVGLRFTTVRYVTHGLVTHVRLWLLHTVYARTHYTFGCRFTVGLPFVYVCCLVVYAHTVVTTHTLVGYARLRLRYHGYALRTRCYWFTFIYVLVTFCGCVTFALFGCICWVVHTRLHVTTRLRYVTRYVRLHYGLLPLPVGSLFTVTFAVTFTVYAHVRLRLRLLHVCFTHVCTFCVRYVCGCRLRLFWFTPRLRFTPFYGYVGLVALHTVYGYALRTRLRLVTVAVTLCVVVTHYTVPVCVCFG